MKKRFLPLIIMLVLFLAMTISVSASAAPRLVDDAGLLTDAQFANVNAKLNEISERLQFDVVIVTLETLNGQNVESAAEDYYDYNGYGFNAQNDGVILLISMEERDWTVTTTGFGNDALNSDARDYVSKAFVPDLSAGDYENAFLTFANMCDDIVAKAQNGKFYKKPFNFGGSLIAGAIIGLIVAGIATSSEAGKLKSVKMKYSAADYVIKNSLNLTTSRERFLYRKVDRTAKAQSSSSSGSRSSASGVSHSSTSGKF